MGIFDPRSAYWIEHHGTSNGNSLSMAAGVATLDLFPQAEIERINALGDRLSSWLASALDESGLDVHLTSYGSIMNIRGNPDDVTRLHRAGLDAGSTSPRGMLCISTRWMTRQSTRLFCVSKDNCRSINTVKSYV